MDFSLFSFACYGTGNRATSYELLLEMAQFADRHGFTAVWTPERHFHGFGGSYPNPALTSAALAMVTERVQLRAGSVVLPLHDPIRVAEEWCVVDNLSGGRVAVSFASGWNPDDFVLAPDRFAERRKLVGEQIETVRRLWRGEPIVCVNGAGRETEIRTFPRPVQAELPIWITATGHPDTFVWAGRLGANVLTHLLGQSIEDLAGKIALYRHARQAAGHAAAGGRVTLMLHTFVGEDVELVRRIVRQPLLQYLSISADLMRRSDPAFSAPSRMNSNQAFKDAPLPEEEDMDVVLACAFERHFGEGGVFGTPESCRPLVERLRRIGVDEIASLVDFGIEPELVLSNLPSLRRLMVSCRESTGPVGRSSVEKAPQLEPAPLGAE